MGRIDPPAPQGERDFEALVEAYQLPLLRMCAMQLGDGELAKDAVQETFLKAYRSLSAFRGDSSPGTWLTRIALNTCRDMQRSRWHRYVNRRLPLEAIPLAWEDAPEEAIAVAEAIAALPPKLKETVLLYYYRNMQLEEIGEVLGIHMTSVSGRLTRARSKLRTALKGGIGDD